MPCEAAWGTWLSPSVPSPSLPYSCATAIVTSSGPFTPAQLATELTPSSCFHSVCQEFPCGCCDEDICATQLGGPRLLQVSCALQGG